MGRLSVPASVIMSRLARWLPCMTRKLESSTLRPSVKALQIMQCLVLVTEGVKEPLPKVALVEPADRPRTRPRLKLMMTTPLLATSLGI